MAESLGWLAPAPLWGEGEIGLESSELLQPFLTELMSDQFVTEFLGMIGAQGGASPTSLAAMAPLVGAGTATSPYRLFQPLSQRYYLVTASLVCRRVGIPDRGVRPSQGERTSFVLRRVAADGSEQAWVPATGRPASPGDPPSGMWTSAVFPAQLVGGEEQLPMHAAPVAGFADPGTTAAAFGMSEPGRRTIYYGYIATGRRERMVTALSDADAVAALQSVDPTGQENPIMSALWTRVITPWGMLVGKLPSSPAPAPPPAGTDTDYSSLYVLLDLADWLQSWLPTVYTALTGGAGLTAGTAGEELRAALAGIPVGARAAPPDQPPPPPAVWSPGAPTFVPLSRALQDLTGFAPLVTGAGNTLPTVSYDLVDQPPGPPSPPLFPLPDQWFANAQTGPATPSASASLAYLALAALNEFSVTPVVPTELSGMIKTDPAAPTPGYAPDTFIIRTVFEHDPCVPVLSQPSRSFQLARALDGDAPARKIRIALPDISNLRQFQRGVAIEMPPSLRRTLDRVTPAMLQGKGLGNDPGPELGMICSFSIQIMWVLSFIVMFLFAISFNIMFWWLAFIKICFPIPVPASKSQNPAP
ncbi:MAG: hypothetical protein ABSF03_22260 [Streptosporangiaceae bacterium]|jgi:hypothetical protein